MVKYPYTIPGDNVYKPWLPVRLGYRKTHKIMPASVIALIDSGADVCFCEKNLGLWLGAKLTKGETKTFITANRGSFEAIKDTLTLYVCGTHYDCPFYFTNSLPRETPIILGQRGFFDHFVISFDLKNKEIEIKIN